MGGDLNFTIGHVKSWGHNAQLDPLFDFMEKLLEQHHMIDIPMNKKQPTWHNRRIIELALGRRLDHFLIKEKFLGTLSNHSPIYMELAGPFQKPREPFEFNSAWLVDLDYHKLFTNYW